MPAVFSAPRKALTSVLVSLLIALLSCSGECLGADDEAEPPKAALLAKQRLELMQSAIDDLAVSSESIETPQALKLGASPLLRYADQTRGLEIRTQALLDAGLWRMGERGRPTALVTLEIYRVREGEALLSYEFLSLTDNDITMKSPRGPTWAPTGTDLKMAAFTDVPRPAASPRARLAQMRRMAARFSVHEEYNGEKVECRLLSQPIDRYDDGTEGLRDGTLFVFANGTNPEVGLLIECTDGQWSYGAFRLSSAAVTAGLDGQTIFEVPAVAKYPVGAPYTATRHTISVPE
jgi:hypothetical protein